MELLLDTNVVLYFLGGEYKTVRLVSRANRLAVSFISVIELLSFHANEEETKSIKAFLAQVEILYPDDETVQMAIEIRKASRLKVPDALIAAHARQRNLILATADKEILERIIDIEIINPQGVYE